MAIFIACNGWLDKTLTLADWGCEIDMALGTYRQSIQEEEKEILQLMEAYAVNDCFAVTRIMNETRSWRPLTLPTTNGPCFIRWMRWRSTLESRRRTIPVRRERKIADGSWEIWADTSKRYVTSSFRHERNQMANRRHPAQTYRFEVIRRIRPSFNIMKVKGILQSINITYVNMNIVRHTLFIGLKNKQLIDETEKLLHERLFTPQHFQRLYLKKEEPKWSCRHSACFERIRVCCFVLVYRRWSLVPMSI